MARRGHQSAAGGGSEALAEVRKTPQENVDATPIGIGGETFWISEFSLNQISALMRTALKAATRMTTEEREGLAKTVGSDNANLAAIVALLDSDSISELFGVVLDKPADWCGTNVKARHILALVDAVVERNDWKELWAGFLRLRQRFENSAEAA